MTKLTAIGQPARDPDTHTKTVLDYKFSVALKNNRSKNIVGVQWDYFFYPKDPASDPLAYLFVSKTSIAPGKAIILNDSIPARGISGVRTKFPTKHSRGLYVEKVVILHLDYSVKARGTVRLDPEISRRGRRGRQTARGAQVTAD